MEGENNAYVNLETITARLSIARFRELSVQSNAVDIDVIEMSIEGIRFECDLQFPASDHLLLKFNASLFNRDFTLYGTIVEKRKLENGRYFYAVKFENKVEKEPFDRMITNMASILQMKSQQDESYYH